MVDRFGKNYSLINETIETQTRVSIEINAFLWKLEKTFKRYLELKED